MIRRPTFLPTRLVPLAVALIGFVSPVLVSASDATESLLRLLPPDTSLTISVDNLRGHYKTVLASSLAEGVRRLPGVKAWFDSGQFRAFEQARGHIEGLLEVNWDTFLEEILGDSVVLGFHLPAGVGPEGGRGILMLKARDRALLKKLIKALNTTQTASGELKQLVEKRLGTWTYTARRYNDGRPDDYFILLDDGTYAWTNSEAWVKELLTRKSDPSTPNLWTDPLARSVREKLPATAVLQASLHPGFLVRVFDSFPTSDKPAEARLLGSIRSYVQALRFAGLAVEWKDGVVLHTHEALEPAKLEPWLRAWMTAKPAAAGLLRKVPQGAFLISSLQLDVASVAGYLDGFVPENDRWVLDNLLTALRGVALDQDIRSAILPKLGPRVVAYAESPESTSGRFRIPMVAALALNPAGEGPAISDSVRNGLRTMLAVIAMDPSHRGSHLKVASRSVDGVEVTVLGNAMVYFAFAVGPDHVAVSNSVEAVARFEGSPPARWLDTAGAGEISQAGALAFVNLTALSDLASRYRDSLAERSASRRGGTKEAALDDLDHAIALSRLFRCAFLTSTAASDASSVHRTLGLLASAKK